MAGPALMFLWFKPGPEPGRIEAVADMLTGTMFGKIFTFIIEIFWIAISLIGVWRGYRRERQNPASEGR